MTKRLDNQLALVRTAVAERRPRDTLPVIGHKPTTYEPEAYGALCKICPLQKNAVIVPPTEARVARKPKLIIIGEGPGRVECNRGEPFVGPSGRLLNQHFDKHDFDRADAHVTNTVLCRADDEKDLAAAVTCCAPRLSREIGKLDAKTPILILGGIGAKLVLGARSILMARGFVWEAPTPDEKKIRALTKQVEKALTNGNAARAMKLAADVRVLEGRRVYAGRTVVPSIHPAFVLRADTWGPIMGVDIARAIRLSRGEVVLLDHGEHTIVSRREDIEKAFRTLRHDIAVDIESNGPHWRRSKMLCIGASDGKRTVVIHPFRREMIHAITRAFKPHTIIGHNFINFDKLMLERYGVRFDGVNIEDTLIAHHAVASHLPQRLDHVVSVYVDSSPWKINSGRRGAEEKGLAPWQKGGDALTYYNASDCRVTRHVWPAMQPDLEEERHVYEHDKKLAYICADMQVAGFKMDMRMRDELSKALRYRASALLGEMRRLVNDSSFHPARLGEVRNALFTKFSGVTASITKRGLPSTSSATLEALKGSQTKASKLADLILRWRSAAKTRGTFLEGILIESDGRVHPNWRAYGTVTGRLSCRSPNLQNLPRLTPEKDGTIDITNRVRECFVARRGCKFVYFDLSQAEARFAAHVSGDTNFIETCKGDVHVGNAKILFPDAREILERDPKGAGKPFRDIAKNATFAVTYLAEADTVFQFLASKGFPISLSDVNAMLDRMKMAYRGYYRFVEEKIDFCRAHGHLRTPILGRVRWLGWYPKPTECANFSIQGGIADAMNARIIQMQPKLRKIEGAKLVAQIHDACIFEVKNDDVEAVRDLVAEMWRKPIVLERSTFVMPIDLKVGERMSDF